jgi:DNA-binding NtrC family response regulator
MYNKISKRVLLVDDEPAILSILSRTLAAAGYVVETAESGAQALEIASVHEFDVIVTDCLMSGMNGVTLAEASLKIHPQARVIFMTGHLSPEITAALGREEVIGLLRKPFMPPELLEMLERAFEEKDD